MPEAEKAHKRRIGEMLLDYGLITHEQLSKALERQMSSGRRIGSLLQEMGLVDGDTLGSVLSRQHGIPPVNLSELSIPPDVLQLVPFDRVKSHGVLPFEKTDEYLSLAMVDPGDAVVINEIERSIGGIVRPFIAPVSQMEKAIETLEKEGYGKRPFDGRSLKDEHGYAGTAIPGIKTLLKLLPDFNATALHLAAGARPSMRVNGELRRLSMPRIPAAQIREYALELIPPEKLGDLERGGDVDFVYSMPERGRFRITLYRQRNSLSLSARRIYENVPTFEDLNLPDWLAGYAMEKRGLIIIAGLPAEGKATTLAAFVNEVNSRRRCNVVTFENPIRYLHRHNSSNVNQREIGIDTDSFASGLRRIHLQDPDVIVIEEMMDADCISMALSAAESGCLVIGAVDASGTLSALERIMGVFPEDRLAQVRTQLSEMLLLVFAQKLIPLRDGSGRVPAFEKLMNSTRVANLIRDGKAANLRPLMQVASEDISAMDRSIARLCLDGRITFESGLRYADDPAYYQELIRSGAA
jgi:twitching motility protein PilT